MAPIFLKDYNWNETDKMINVKVCIPGITPGNYDLSLTDQYIKINCRPFIWELFLQKKINCKKSKVVIDNGIITLHLNKADAGKWHFIAQSSGDVDSLVERRQAELVKMEQLIRQRQEHKSKHRYQQDNKAREQYQNWVHNQRELNLNQIEKDKMESLNSPPFSWTANQSRKTDGPEAPIRAYSCIHVEFTHQPEITN